MEVTSENFKEVLPKIEETIKQATFLSVDCEFSGLNVVSEINAFDTPKQYYEKVRRNCREFLVIQYGISAFRFDPAIDGFKQQSYNFYVFRRPINRNIPDQRFLCQTSSIHFLISQGFDFNKLFKSGISYLNLEEENNYREKIEEKQKNRGQNNQMNQESISIPEENQPFIDEIVERLNDFLESDEDEIELPKCNAFIRRLIYQLAGEKYKNRITMQTKQMKNRDRILVATKFKTLKEREEAETKLFEEEVEALEDFIGFTKVLRIIIDSGKLVVGHNMCLDFLHTIDKFLTPLPEDYDDFKDCAHSLFKNILDTKFLASSDALRDLVTSTVLGDMMETLSKEPFNIPTVEIEDGGQGYTLEDKKEHEAGYDAYITGLSFITMWNYLGGIDNLSTLIFKDYNLLGSYLNKLFLMVLKDNQCINLDGEDLSPSRDHVFYLTFPKDWKLSNVMELFSPFGNVYVSWLSDTSAYVMLFRRDQAAVALSTLSQSDTYSITTFAKRQLQLAGINTPVSSPLIRRKRSLEGAPSSNKRMRIDSRESTSVRKISSIKEDVEAESDGKTPQKRARKGPKIFAESDAWD